MRLSSSAPHWSPGLLQTAEYARNAIRLSGISRKAEIEAGVQARLDRQKALSMRKRFSFVLAESALRSRVGGVPAMLRQIRHLKRLSSRKKCHHRDHSMVRAAAGVAPAQFHGVRTTS